MAIFEHANTDRQSDTGTRIWQYALAGFAFWWITAFSFALIAWIDLTTQARSPDFLVLLGGFLYGYASWWVLAPAVFAVARSWRRLPSGTLIGHAAGLLLACMCVLVVYCIGTGAMIDSMNPIESLARYSLFEWLWDVFLFAVVFQAGLQKHQTPDTIEPPVPLARLAVRSPDHIEYVPIASIQGVSAQGNYAALLLEDRQTLHRETLSRLQSHLSGAGFVRIHRSHLVHPDFIIAATARGERVREVELRNGHRLPVSEAFSGTIARLLHGHNLQPSIPR